MAIQDQKQLGTTLWGIADQPGNLECTAFRIELDTWQYFN